VAQYISLAGNEAGVFIRGERSVASAAVYSRLKPFVSRLEKALRRELLSDAKYFLHKGKKFQTKDAAKWDETAGWLHKNANAYQDVLRKLWGGLMARTHIEPGVLQHLGFATSFPTVTGTPFAQSREQGHLCLQSLLTFSIP
jgi:hypothetical protein